MPMVPGGAEPPQSRPPVRIRLDVGPTTGTKILTTCFTLVLILALLLLAGIVGALLGPGSYTVVVPLLLVALAGAVALWLKRMRYAVWLEGTTLVFRHLLRTLRCDLAAAQEVTLDAATGYWLVPTGDAAVTPIPAGRVPLLRARRTPQERWATLRLRGRSTSLLPSAQLLALADAIAAGVRPPGPYAQQAHSTAAALRQLAANPLARLR